MTWYERMNEAIGYIEENLCGDIDFGVISKIVGQSPVNFQRTFSAVTDISVFEYIRRRKMTLAAFEFQGGDARVIDVALKYGYESPEAFTRAFKEIHGIPPAATRRHGGSLRAFPRISFLLSVKGAAAMEYKIENKEAFKVYGIEGIFTMEDEQNFRDIPKFWNECMNDGSCDRLVKSTNEPLSRIHAVCDYRATGGNTFSYMIFACRTENSNTEGFTEVEIPAATWAVFKTEKHPQEGVSEAVQSLMKRVYTDWMPTAGYKKLDGYELELYLADELDKCYSEIWIRVEAKQS